MLHRAKANAAKLNLANVEFHLATIDLLPLPDQSVDCVISNCVINLAPDKPAVLREIFRVLKLGGRLAVSDIALKRPLPSEIAADVMAYVGCIAGAVMIENYERDLRTAGFESVQIVDTRKDLNAYAKVENQSACCSPTMLGLNEQSSNASCCSESSVVHGGLAELLQKHNVNDYAASVQVYALKPSN
jgi:arsenite methyltransferase